eukprot:9470737-Pyramimonas_sp.AAC.1
MGNTCQEFLTLRASPPDLPAALLLATLSGFWGPRGGAWASAGAFSVASFAGTCPASLSICSIVRCAPA